MCSKTATLYRNTSEKSFFSCLQHFVQFDLPSLVIGGYLFMSGWGYPWGISDTFWVDTAYPIYQTVWWKGCNNSYPGKREKGQGEGRREWCSFGDTGKHAWCVCVCPFYQVLTCLLVTKIRDRQMLCKQKNWSAEGLTCFYWFHAIKVSKNSSKSDLEYI